MLTDAKTNEVDSLPKRLPSLNRTLFRPPAPQTQILNSKLPSYCYALVYPS